MSGKSIARFAGIFEGFSKDRKRLLIRSGDTYRLFDSFGRKSFKRKVSIANLALILKDY
jgi:hypothetical protein